MMKLVAFASVSVAALLLAVHGTPQDCSQFWVDACHNHSGNLIATVMTDNAEECRNDCDTVFDHCTMFIFTNDSAADMNCELYNFHIDNYIQQCNITGGPAGLPSYDECLDHDHDDNCNQYRMSECDLQGTEIETIELPDPASCQALCNSDPDCQHFTYNEEDNACTTFDSATADCYDTIGPDSPSLDSC